MDILGIVLVGISVSLTILSNLMTIFYNNKSKDKSALLIFYCEYGTWWDDMAFGNPADCSWYESMNTYAWIVMAMAAVQIALCISFILTVCVWSRKESQLRWDVIGYSVAATIAISIGMMAINLIPRLDADRPLKIPGAEFSWGWMTSFISCGVNLAMIGVVLFALRNQIDN